MGQAYSDDRNKFMKPSRIDRQREVRERKAHVHGVPRVIGEDDPGTPVNKREHKQHSPFGVIVERIAKRIGSMHMNKVFARGEHVVQEKLQTIPARMQLLTNQASLVLELMQDFKADRYRDVPWRSIAIGAAAMLYSISPSDVIPDFVPVIGAMDDALVVGIALRMIRQDLEKYCRFKGYDVSEYFA